MRSFLTRIDLHGLALVAVALVALRDGARLADTMAKKINIDAVGPHGYLYLLGAIMVALGVILLLQRAPSTGETELPPVPWRQITIALGLLIAYAYSVDIVGFTFATFAFLLLISRHLSAGSWLWCGGFSVVATASFYLAFVRLSDMALPKGILWD